MTNKIPDPARFSALFENSPDAIASVRLEDDAFVVTEVNAAFEDTFGYDAGTIVGSDIDEYIVPPSHLSPSIGAAMADGERVEREVKRETANGIRDFLVRTAPFELDNGWPGGYVIYSDISEQKRRERLLGRYETILDVLPDPVFTVAETGTFTYVNEAFAGLFDTDSADIVGDSVTAVLDEEQAALYEQHAERLRAPGADAVVRYELATTSPDGRNRVFETHLTLLPGEESAGVAGVLLDITDRRAQAERLESLATVVSHDLRNPLQVASARVEMARQSDGDAGADSLDAASRALGQIESLIDDLLAVAREGDEAFAPERVGIATVAREAATTVPEDVRIDVSALGTVVAERTQLLQLFANLFQNAVAYGGDSVRIRVEPTTGGFAVVDDGPGIPADAETDVFRRGFTTSEDGSGVGLTIVQRVADIHDWTVTASNDPDTGGARIEVTGL